ncbi:MAG: acyltransferase family protein, partial [Thalassotalea sp.]|nr:acyltransferase family protein [Thalassotalea sp.]
MKYRREIDGLRAIAVLPVILFHAGLFGFTGGYIGVDIFFVISGYLITSIILDELKSEKFSVKQFYERRARRILPALSAVLLVTTAVAVILMPNDLLKAYFNSLMSVVTFTSNFYFFETIDYFSTISEQKPLLHTWSLAVEEQYYLFFPLLLMWLWHRGVKFITTTVVILTLISLGLAHWLSLNDSPEASFYLISSRAWELFAGSLIALSAIEKKKFSSLMKQCASMIGIALILYSIFAFDDATPFPSFYTLVPIIGTCLILIFTTNETWLGKILSTKIFVGIGLISYSLYLWHQPVFAFIRLKTVGHPSDVIFFIAILITFIFAILSYYFVETPCRKKSFPKKTPILRLAAYSIVLFIVIGIAGVATKGLSFRFESSYLESAKASPLRKQCHADSRNPLTPVTSCRYFEDDVTWATLGDSHTVETAYALASELKKSQQGVLHLSFTSCVPALTFSTAKEACSEWMKNAVALLENQSEIKNVLVGFRYNLFLYGDHQLHYPDIPNENPVLKIKSTAEALSAQQVRNMYWQNFELLIDRLSKAGK